MCYNCDCGNPDDTMGSDSNITNQITFTNLANKWGISFDEVRKLAYAELTGQKVDDDKKHDLDHMYDEATKAWGQTVEEARTNTLKLLKRELGL
jgi:hypothetical protein